MKIRAFLLSGFLAVAAALSAANETTAKAEPAPRYDKSAEIDLMAVVTDAREVSRDAPLIGIYISVRSESDAPFEIYLGPSDFVKGFEITFNKGNRVHIFGSKVKVGGNSVVLAREVRKNESTLYLRDLKGEPYWAAK